MLGPELGPARVLELERVPVLGLVLVLVPGPVLGLGPVLVPGLALHKPRPLPTTQSIIPMELTILSFSPVTSFLECWPIKIIFY